MLLFNAHIKSEEAVEGHDTMWIISPHLINIDIDVGPWGLKHILWHVTAINQSASTILTNQTTQSLLCQKICLTSLLKSTSYTNSIYLNYSESLSHAYLDL